MRIRAKQQKLKVHRAQRQSGATKSKHTENKWSENPPNVPSYTTYGLT